MKKSMAKNAWLFTLVMTMVFSAGVAMAQDADEFEPAKPADGSAAAKAEGDKAPPAEGEKAGDGQEGKDGQGGGLFGSPTFLYIMLGMIVLMFVFSSRSKKKQKKKRQDLNASINKGSKVVTIGGIVGTVVEARDDEIIVKIDDNIRMKFARWAIRSVGDEAQADKKDDTQQQR